MIGWRQNIWALCEENICSRLITRASHSFSGRGFRGRWCKWLPGDQEEKYGNTDTSWEHFYHIKTDLRPLTQGDRWLEARLCPLLGCICITGHVTGVIIVTVSHLSDGVLHHQHVCHGPELTKILPEPLLICLPTEAAHKQLPGGRVWVGRAATAGLAL